MGLDFSAMEVFHAITNIAATYQNIAATGFNLAQIDVKSGELITFVSAMCYDDSLTLVVLL